MSADILAFGPANGVRQLATEAIASATITHSGAIARFREGRVVAVNYSPFAPPGRETGHTMFGPPIAGAVREILTRLGRSPAHVTPAALALGDVAILTAKPGEPRVPLAFVYEGLTAAEISGALDQLAKEGWEPGPPPELWRGSRP
jgi:hypothetical protein